MMSVSISEFTTKGKASVIFDGQFGSTGKGLAGAWVGEHNDIDWSVTNASANAGHTSIIDGKPVVLFHIPSTWLTGRLRHRNRIYIDAGAIIDLPVLIREIEELGIDAEDIVVNPNAAVILPEDKEAEADTQSSQTKIASTQKGVGASLSRKVRRSGPNLGQYLETLSGGVPFLVDTLSLNREMSFGKTVVVEVPQGFSLSLNASGFYPYTTSRDCTLQQGLSDAGIHPRYFHRSMAVIRTYPIRVGNITDGNGVIGYSGDVYLDQQETSWSALGQPEERTTVTKRVRRVFDFSAVQYWEMLEYSEPDYVFLNFLNYMNADQVRVLEERMDNVERSLRIKPVRFYGYGPASHDISTYRRKIR